jgi:hypothetical protein
LLAQEKVPKEKGPRSTHRLRRSPAFLANPGAAHNSALYGAKTRPVNHLKQGARLFPGLAAVLGEYNGFKVYPSRRRSRASQ